MIKQNIVFIENKAGSLQKVTGLLAEAGIDIYGFACFDAPEFALFRMVTNQADEAEKIGGDIWTALKTHNTSELLWKLDSGVDAASGVSALDLRIIFIGK